MTLHFYSRFHICGIKSIVLCRKNQPDVWDELSSSLSYRKNLVVVVVTLVFYQFFMCRTIKRFCDECKKDWESVLRDKVVPLFEKLFDCQIKREVQCYIGFYPTYLRNISKRFFLLPYGVSYSRYLEIMIHEISHFYCYEASGNALSSDKLWLLSEQIVPYIMKQIFEIKNPSMCYVREESIREKSLYSSWVEGKISFKEVVKTLKKNE